MARRDVILLKYKRLTLFAGHYGSGKTNIAINYALWLKGMGLDVTVADLDIVNPYFRTKDSETLLAQQGIRLVCSPFANSNLDVPAMPREVYALLEPGSGHAVLDIGGDDRGALALGRYAPDILAEGDYEMLFVANRFRPLTRTPREALEVMGEVEQACSLPFTAIVNNSNLGPDTTAEDVRRSADYARELAALSGLPVKMTAARADLCKQLQPWEGELFPLTLQELYYQLHS